MPVPIGWVLMGLCFGTLVLAETEAEFSECSQSFYKQTPPVGFSGGELQPHCHSLSAGRTFASLHSTSCDSTVLSAFCLHKTWGETDEHTETGTEEMEESQTAEEDLPIATPALLKRDGHNVYTSSGSPADPWDALVSELVKNNIHPQCQSLGGDLYVLTGKGGAEDVGQGCELDLLWSAMCCAGLDDEVVFSLGVVKEGEGEARVLDVNGLAEAVGVEGIFLGGCEVADGGEAGAVFTFAFLQNALQQIVGMHNTDAQLDPSDTIAEGAIPVESSDEQEDGTTLSDSSEAVDESATVSEFPEMEEESAALSDSSETGEESATQSDYSETVEESAAQSVYSETVEESATQTDYSETVEESATQTDYSETVEESATQTGYSETVEESATQTGYSETVEESAPQTDSSGTVEESAPQPERVDAAAESSLAESAETSSSPSPSEEEEDESAGVLSRCSASFSASQESSATQAAEESRAEPQGNSTILRLLSFSLWVLTTPVRPVTSTLTKIPGQVTHVIREDLAVLSSLPGDTLSLVNNVAGDTYRGVSSAVGLVGRAGSTCASCLYSCASPLVGALLSSCQDGVTGVGTLTWDGVGIFGGVLNRALSVTKYFGGRTWDQSGGFLWAVLSELGNQSKRAGGGLGKLAFRGGKGVVNTVSMAGRIVWGTLATTVEMVKEVFGDD